MEIYLRGAKAESISREVVCAGISVYGAPVVVPNALHDLLADKLVQLDIGAIASFLSYRANKAFAALMLERCPNLMTRLHFFVTPIKEDPDASLLAKLHEFGLLPEEIRANFVDASMRQQSKTWIQASWMMLILRLFSRTRRRTKFSPMYAVNR